MTAWNYNIDEAPRGRFEIRTRSDAKNRNIKYEVFIPDMIIAASRSYNGAPGVVTSTYWKPNEKRWSMFATGEVPLAWTPWPEHPGDEV